jgi:hypothetical protein
MIDSYLKALILRQPGNNQKLSQEILEKLSPESRRNLFRLMQELESKNTTLKSKIRRYQLY